MRTLRAQHQRRTPPPHVYAQPAALKVDVAVKVESVPVKNANATVVQLTPKHVSPVAVPIKRLPRIRRK